MQIRTIIVEDNQEALKVFKQISENFFPQIKVVAEFKNANEAFVFIKHNHFDLLVLDVELEGDLNGLEVLTLLGSNTRFKTVFYTGNQNLILQAMRLGAFDYLTKPLSIIDFKNTINRFLKIQNNQNSQNNNLEIVEKEISGIENTKTIKINTHSKTLFLKISDIQYLIANGAYTIIHYINNNSIKSSKNLSYYYQLLIEENFIKASRSLIVNRIQIEKINKNENEMSSIIFKDGNKIEISQRIRKQIMNQINLK